MSGFSTNFRNDFQDAATNLKELLAGGKTDEAVILAHTVKGAAGNIGAEELQEAAAVQEKRLKEGEQELPQAVLADFSTALTTVLESLKALQPAGTLAGAEPDVELSPLPRDAAAEIARRLRDAAAAGDVTELAAIAAELETRHDMGRCYGEELQRLTDEFDFDKILILAETMEK